MARYRANNIMRTNTTATSVVAISRVRRLKRQGSQGSVARPAVINIGNQIGNISFNERRRSPRLNHQSPDRGAATSKRLELKNRQLARRL